MEEINGDRIDRFHTSKLTEKQMDKVTQIVHPKLRPFHFQIKTHHLYGANYPTDNLSWVPEVFLACDEELSPGDTSSYKRAAKLFPRATF